jgi:mannosyltransferase OCH1-like enzyme
MELDYRKNMVNAIKDSKEWKFLEDLYYKNYVNVSDKTEKRIPKIIHQIWLGSDFPERYKEFQNKLIKLHPDWEYKLWTDKDVDEFCLKNNELYYNIKNKGAKSDIFRYEILEKMGGVYLDIDFDPVKPFDDLCYLDFFAGCGHVPDAEVFNSIMASSPNHKYIKKLVIELQKMKTFSDHIEGVMQNTGPYFITRNFFNTIGIEDNAVVFPTKFFFSFPAMWRDRVTDSKNSWDFIYSFVTENSYCIHLWHTNWQK